jgi:hypothetical protein
MKFILIGLPEGADLCGMFRVGTGGGVEEVVILSTEESAQIRAALNHALEDAGRDPV